MKFILEQSNELISSHSGLALVGELLNLVPLKKRLNLTRLKGVSTPSISNGDVVAAHIGLLCQGKNDFDCIEQFREDDFFAILLGLKQVPSSPTLRQRLDTVGRHPQWNKIILEEAVHLIKKVKAPITPIS